MIDHNEIRIARTEMQRRLRMVPGCEGAHVGVQWSLEQGFALVCLSCDPLARAIGAEHAQFRADDFRRAQSSFYAALAKIEPSNAEDVLKAKLAERCAREMNAELPADDRHILELKGMI